MRLKDNPAGHSIDVMRYAIRIYKGTVKPSNNLYADNENVKTAQTFLSSPDNVIWLENYLAHVSKKISAQKAMMLASPQKSLLIQSDVLASGFLSNNVLYEKLVDANFATAYNIAMSEATTKSSVKQSYSFNLPMIESYDKFNSKYGAKYSLEQKVTRAMAILQSGSLSKQEFIILADKYEEYFLAYQRLSDKIKSAELGQYELSAQKEFMLNAKYDSYAAVSLTPRVS